jgi:DNA-binding NarL/FixJ family response regulator
LVNEPIRVVLIGTERATRAGLRILLDGHPGLRVIAEAESAGDLGGIWSGPQLQIAVMDLDGGGGASAIPNVREAGMSNTRVIVLTSTPESAVCSQAIERGVMGVVSKQQGPEVLVKAIERVHAGELWLNRTRIAGVVGGLRAAQDAEPPARKIGRPVTLLPRERQITTLVGQGFRNNEIAETIFVSEATVRNCLGTIFKKLGFTSRVHLMIYALQEGLVDHSVSGNPTTAAARREGLRLATSEGRQIRASGPTMKGHIK